MEREQQKPDLAGTVNGLDIRIFRRGRGLENSVDDETGQEVIKFRYLPQGTREEREKPTLPPVPVASSLPSSVPAAPEQVTQPTTEVKTPIKLTGIVESIEGMGTTPQSGDPVFRFSLRWINPKTNTEEVSHIAAFRHIAQTLNQFHISPDPNIKLQPGRSISMMAWDHTATSGSYYPSSVNYLTFPAITNPKMQKRR